MDIRWKQRLVNFGKAFLLLVEASEKSDLSVLEKEGMIQRFEYTYELAWKTLQDLIAERGYIDVKGPTLVLDKALEIGLIDDIIGWKALKKSRELSSHTYNNETAEDLYFNIIENYIPLFFDLKATLEKEATK
jgi:nucleotidyltransferase substrate binding protein (TIGR01987 family)